MDSRRFPERWLSALAIAFVVALRLLHADQPIVENYVGRQVPTAMVARNLERGSGFLRPQLDTAPFPNLFLVEPPIYAQVVATLRRVIPARREAIGRCVSALATGLAAWGLYGLARRREGPRIALLAVVTFGLFPVMIRYGRAFQPDALMLGLMLAGLRVWDDHEAEGGRFRLVVAWLLIATGLAVKVVSASLLVPLVVSILRPPRAKKVAIVATTLAPAIAWYLYAANVVSEGSRASADNAAFWVRAFGLRPLLRPETWTTSARFLFVRSFTPVGIALATWGLFLRRPSDRLWRVWLAATALAFLAMAGKIHHEYYWMTLAPALAVGVARGAMLDGETPGRPSPFAVLLYLAFVVIALAGSASTWRTPPEWRALPVAVAECRRIADPSRPGPVFAAPEALLQALGTRGFRLEVEPAARLRAAGEFGRTIDANDPLALLEFYRSQGARFVADLWPVGDEPDRRLLHDAIRRRYNVKVDRDGVLIAELVDPSAP